MVLVKADNEALPGAMASVRRPSKRMATTSMADPTLPPISVASPTGSQSVRRPVHAMTMAPRQSLPTPRRSSSKQMPTLSRPSVKRNTTSISSPPTIEVNPDPGSVPGVPEAAPELQGMSAEASVAKDAVPEPPKTAPAMRGSPHAARFLKAKSDFDICMASSKRHQIPIGTVKQHYDEFRALDKSGDGFLTPDEFESAVRALCRLKDDAATPPHLFDAQWQMLDPMERGYVEFDEYLVWSRTVAFRDEVAEKDPTEEMMRKLVRTQGFDMMTLERVRCVFSQYSEGELIDFPKFKSILCRVMGLKAGADVPEDTVRRYFREVDQNMSGAIDFEEFAMWYLRVHN